MLNWRKLIFSINGYDVSFDANGDPVAKYELVNWQKSESGSVELVTVGHYDASLLEAQEFHINRNLPWVDVATQVKTPQAIINTFCFQIQYLLPASPFYMEWTTYTTIPI